MLAWHSRDLLLHYNRATRRCVSENKALNLRNKTLFSDDEGGYMNEAEAFSS